MIPNLVPIISQHHLNLESKEPFIVIVKDSDQGINLAKDILYEISDKKTALFLSGGRTPKELYHTLAKEEKLIIGAVGIVDERFGPPALVYGKSHWRAGQKMHEDSNEKMIEQTGLLHYLQKEQTLFYPILQNNASIRDTALQYDETLRFLFNGFQKSIGILGIGLDGHTAGLPIGYQESKNHSLVTYCTDFPGEQKERISMTFLGLSGLDMLLVLVFGKDKKEALQNMFISGSESEIPARFFKRSDIAKKTLIITDQKV